MSRACQRAPLSRNLSNGLYFRFFYFILRSGLSFICICGVQQCEQSCGQMADIYSRVIRVFCKVHASELELMFCSAAICELRALCSSSYAGSHIIVRMCPVVAAHSARFAAASNRAANAPIATSAYSLPSPGRSRSKSQLSSGLKRCRVESAA